MQSEVSLSPFSLFHPVQMQAHRYSSTVSSSRAVAHSIADSTVALISNVPARGSSALLRQHPQLTAKLLQHSSPAQLCPPVIAEIGICDSP
jgi:hypothetical protein